MNTFVKISAHAFFVFFACSLVGGERGESTLTKESIEMHIIKKKNFSSPESTPTAYQQLHEAEEVSTEDANQDTGSEGPPKISVWQKFVAWFSKKTK